VVEQSLQELQDEFDGEDQEEKDGKEENAPSEKESVDTDASTTASEPQGTKQPLPLKKAPTWLDKQTVPKSKTVTAKNKTTGAVTGKKSKKALPLFVKPVISSVPKFTSQK